MQGHNVRFILSSSLLICVSAAYAGAMTEVLTSHSPWAFEFGPRYWFSTNQYTNTLYSTNNALLSRLTFNHITGNAAEGFWQLSHENGLFLKGYFGGGSLTNGGLNDEDFPPETTPYSNTYAPQKEGSLKYLSADLGYQFFKGSHWQVSGFMGYHYWNEHLNTFGCTQIAGNTSICGMSSEFTPVSSAVNTLDNDATWQSLRIGANGTIRFGEALDLIADVAYVHSALSANDYHNLRPDIRGLIEDGTGNGVQLDARLNWMLTQNFSFGVGGRWWQITTDGFDHFEQTSVNGQPQPIRVTQDSYGLLVQSNYQFDSDKPTQTYEPNLSPFWPGVYMGMNLGYGTNPSIVYIYPSSSYALLLQDNGLSPMNLNVQDAGFLVGGQIGYNWQVKEYIAGIESDLDYASIDGTNGINMKSLNATTVNKSIEWLATVRGRIGKLASEHTLVYFTGGPAFGGVTLSLDQEIPGVSCPFGETCSQGSVSKNKTGWAAGAGIEYAASGHATFKAEYLYVDLGSIAANTVDSAIPPFATYDASSIFNDNILRLGINYKV